ncbi:Hypothetical predicted protein, partial [Mytilus galloprovincialis]
AGTICLSCSGVETKEQCSHLETCRNDEICFIHKYLTESGAQQFDLGCTYPELCAKWKPAFALGKRLAEGHHMVCQGCCNSTNVCNLNTPCDIAVNHNTSIIKRVPRECEDINNTKSGVYTIYPDSYTPRRAFCIMTKTEKWTARNDAIHKISSSTGHQLSIYMEDFDSNFVYANYSNFLIGDEMENYQLTVYGFSGSPGVGDSMIFTNHNSFTTKDRDYDPDPYMNCAQFRLGAWWYNLCGDSNLNGQYLAGLTTNYTSAHWYYWKNNYYSLKKITMMIKRIRKTD